MGRVRSGLPEAREMRAGVRRLGGCPKTDVGFRHIAGCGLRDPLWEERVSSCLHAMTNVASFHERVRMVWMT